MLWQALNLYPALCPLKASWLARMLPFLEASGQGCSKHLSLAQGNKQHWHSGAGREAHASLAVSAAGVVISGRKVRMTAEGNNFFSKLWQTLLLQFIFAPGCDSGEGVNHQLFDAYHSRQFC